MLQLYGSNRHSCCAITKKTNNYNKYILKLSCAKLDAPSAPNVTCDMSYWIPKKNLNKNIFIQWGV